MVIIYTREMTKGTGLLTQLLHPHSPYALFSTPVYDQRQGVYWLGVEQENHLIKTLKIR
jgi:hypothetical protein